MSTKVAFVVQRYGADIVGGAENLVRQLAEQFLLNLNWEVHVYTTSARDYRTWANSYDPGLTQINGVNVHRFDSLRQRSPFFGLYRRSTTSILKKLRPFRWAKPLVKWLEKKWVVLQGPYCPELLKGLSADAEQYTKIIFVTYLYYPSVFGLPRFLDKALFIPLAHDEDPFYFTMVRECLQDAPRILLNTFPEKILVESVLGHNAKTMEICGLGFDPLTYAPRLRAAKAPNAKSYILYLGRISRGKGVHKLIEWFMQLSEQEPFRQFNLVLVGQQEKDIEIPHTDRICYLGFVDEGRKVQLIEDATLLVNPSIHESLSIIVIEAMALKVPVLVNAKCEVLKYYTEMVPTAFGFTDREQFKAALGDILAIDWQSQNRQDELETSRVWALENFSWPSILKTYQKCIEGVTQTVKSSVMPVMQESKLVPTSGE